MSIYEDMKSWVKKEEAVRETKEICCRRFKDKYGNCEIECPFDIKESNSSLSGSRVGGCVSKEYSIEAVYDYITKDQEKTP